MKIALNSLAIEVTRRCNMACRHCLRGPSQSIPNTVNYEKLFEHISVIENIIFTGGEPSLPGGVAVMERVLEICKRNEIEVQSFYLVTNGKAVSPEFLNICLQWYAYTVSCGYGDLELTGLALSQDKYHDGIPYQNMALLKGFSFFRELDKKTDFDHAPLLDEGCARSLKGQKRAFESYLARFYGEEENFEAPFIDGDMLQFEDPNDILYISSNGEVRIGCDWAYENTVGTIGNINTRKLIDILLDYYKNMDYLRSLYKAVYGKFEIQLLTTNRIITSPVEVENDGRYVNMNVTEVYEVAYVDKTGKVIDSYRTLGTGEKNVKEHIAQLTVCLLRDHQEEPFTEKGETL